jgi:hypothetical protein
VFYIKSSNEFWTGHSWTTQPEMAREYDFKAGLEVIEKRFSKGIRRAKRNGEFFWLERPLLVTVEKGQRHE